MNPLQQMLRQAQQEMITNRGQGVPEQTISQMYSQNPEAAAKVRELLQTGKSPQQLAMEMMNSMHVTPQQLGINLPFKK